MKCTSAVTAISPESFFQAKWKASMAAHMLAPPPVMVYSPVAGLNSTWPFLGVSPTSPLESKMAVLAAASNMAAEHTTRLLNRRFTIDENQNIALAHQCLRNTTP